MARQYALVDGLNKLFDTSINEVGETFYDTTKIKSGVFAQYDVDQSTLYYIKTNQTDKNLGYNGNYVYTCNTLYSNYSDRGGQYLCSNLINTNENDYTGFVLGSIQPIGLNTPWYISYHIQSYSSDITFNSEYDVFIYGCGYNIFNYYAFNGNNENPPFCYHIIKVTNNSLQIGLCLYDTKFNNTLTRNVSYRISNLTNCNYERNVATTTLDNCILIDAKQQGFVEINNNNQLKISNVKLRQIFGNQLKNHPRTLYGFAKNGNIAPLTSVTSNFPYAGLDNNRQYNSIGFDYTRGLFYSNNDDGRLTYVEGNIYSSYSGMDFRYFDNIPEALNISKPVYIRGKVLNGLFYVNPIETEQYKHIWTQDPNEEDFWYWLVGYPQNTDGGYIVNLLENNNLYYFKDNVLSEYSKTISFTPSGTISTPEFYGVTEVINVSGKCDGTNSDSSVDIIGKTTSINNVIDTGELPAITIEVSNEVANFTPGKLPDVSVENVWIGYSEAIAKAQQFNGAVVTFTGSYTPSGTISTPIFTGNEITIVT